MGVSVICGGDGSVSMCRATKNAMISEFGRFRCERTIGKLALGCCCIVVKKERVVNASKIRLLKRMKCGA